MNKKIFFIGTGNFPLFMFPVSVAFATGLISGSYPAIYLSRFQSVKVLKNKLQKCRNGSTFRSFLGLFAYRPTLSVTVYLATAPLTFIITSLTMSYTVIKTALTNPVDILRYE